MSRCSARRPTTRRRRRSTPRSTRSSLPTRTPSILISFDEGSRILRTVVEKGIGPTVKAYYGTDGNMGNALGENFNAGK